jgi:hypothetical protein
MLDMCRQTSAGIIWLINRLIWVDCRRLQVGPLTSLNEHLIPCGSWYTERFCSLPVRYFSRWLPAGKR